MAFALEPFDEQFFADAPQRYRFVMDLEQPVAAVWDAALGGERPLAFVRGLTVRWTSPPPRGVASARIAHGEFGAIRLYERFFIWDKGRRIAFRVERCNVPLFRRFGEDYLLEPLATGCRFTWTFCVEPRGPRALAAVNHIVQRAIFTAFARDTVRHLGGRIVAREISTRASREA